MTSDLRRRQNESLRKLGVRGAGEDRAKRALAEIGDRQRQARANLREESRAKTRPPEAQRRFGLGRLPGSRRGR